jgi:hypothetical protein
VTSLLLLLLDACEADTGAVHVAVNDDVQNKRTTDQKAVLVVVIAVMDIDDETLLSNALEKGLSRLG